MTEMIAYRTGQYSDTDPVSHIWEACEGDRVVGELYVSVDRGEIMNIWVDPARRGEGIARRLYEAATAQMTVYHAPPAHRTPEGDAFARAVGGPTAEYDCDCYGCNYVIDEEEDADAAL